MSRTKYRISNKFRFISFLTVCMLLLAFAGNALLGLGNAAGSDIQRYVTVLVEEGDTLWELAGAYGRSDTDRRKLIYQIEQLNGVSASSLQAGQYISIPADSL